MVCKQCNAEISEGSKFCPICGEKMENEAVNEAVKKFCSECGCEIEGVVKFCPKCGKSQIENSQTISQPIHIESGINKNVKTDNNNLKATARIVFSYIISVITAIVSLVIRVIKQEKFIYWDNIIENKKVLGIDRNMKPYYTIIPIVAAIIVTLIVVYDGKSTSKRKLIAWIENAVVILLAILFIWFDLPYNIIDY